VDNVFIIKDGNGFVLNLFDMKKKKNESSSSLFFPESHFEERFRTLHCIFIDYKK